MKHHEFDDVLKDLATKIDFADLVERGILRRTSRGSYLLLEPSQLPKHASLQVASLATTKAGMKVTFRDTTKAARKLLSRRRPS